MKHLTNALICTLLLLNFSFVLASETVRYGLGDLVPYDNGENTSIFSVSPKKIVLKTFWGGQATSTHDMEVWNTLPLRDGTKLRLLEIDYRSDEGIFEVVSTEEINNLRQEALEKCKEGVKPAPESGLARCPTYCEDQPSNLGCECKNGWRKLHKACGPEENCGLKGAYYECILEERPELRIDDLQYPMKKGVCPKNCDCSDSEISCEEITEETEDPINNSFNELRTSQGIKILNEGGNLSISHSNGKVRKLNVFPNEAKQKIRDETAHCGEENCELAINSNGRYSYDYSKKSKLFGLFSKKMSLSIQVDPENGNLHVEKPWWAFLASES